MMTKQKKLGKRSGKNKHEFALYVKELNTMLISHTPGAQIRISNPDLYHRIVHILRLQAGKICILFDSVINVRFELHASTDKRHVEGTVLQINQNQKLKPYLTFLLPLLKRDQFEAALYSLVELGVNEIQLIVTDKVHRAWGGEKELDRSRAIMYSAAEQSKNFTVPPIREPISLEQYCNEHDLKNKRTLFFDPEGKAMAQVLDFHVDRANEDFVLLVGPEGDLTEQEKLLIKAHGFEFCALTPTVLRASQAVAISTGLIRSIFRF